MSWTAHGAFVTKGERFSRAAWYGAQIMTIPIDTTARELDEKIRAGDWAAAQKLAGELWNPAQTDPAAATAFALFLARLPGPLMDPMPAQLLADRWPDTPTILFPSLSALLDTCELSPIDGPPPKMAIQMLGLLQS